jgi:hypothetical protein
MRARKSWGRMASGCRAVLDHPQLSICRIRSKAKLDPLCVVHKFVHDRAACEHITCPLLLLLFCLVGGWASRRLGHAVHRASPSRGFKRRFSHLLTPHAASSPAVTLRARLAPPQRAEFPLPTANAVRAQCFVAKARNTCYGVLMGRTGRGDGSGKPVIPSGRMWGERKLT